MKNILLLTTTLLFSIICFSQNIDIQAKTFIYKSMDIKSETLKELNILDNVMIVAVADLDAVNNVMDNWYKVKLNVYNEETWEIKSTIEGYVFGECTALKRSGQKLVKKVFEGCDMGDCYYINFGDVDFGGARNADDFNFCDENEEGVMGMAKYMNKEFTLIINDLYTEVYEYCNPDSTPKLVKVPTIVKVVQ